MGVGKDGLPPVAGISEMAVRWPTMSASTRRPGAGKAEIHEAERTLARSRRERLTFVLTLSAVGIAQSRHAARRACEVETLLAMDGDSSTEEYGAGVTTAVG